MSPYPYTILNTACAMVYFAIGHPVLGVMAVGVACFSLIVEREA